MKNKTIPKPKRHILSKSTYMRGLQCPKALYLHKHHKDLADELSESQQAIFDNGTNVGMLARQLFPNGIDCTPESYFDYQKAVVKTAELIEGGTTTIYEAAFQYDDVLVAVDILHKQKGKWYAYEVKSSTSVSETYQKDAGLQYYVVTNAGITLQDMSIVYINNEYIRGEELAIAQLFAIESQLEVIQRLLPGIPNEINRLKAIAKQKAIPVQDIGPHCSDPYPCNFMGHCWSHVPEYSVFNISGLRSNKKFDLYDQGILEFSHIPVDFKMSNNQWLQVNAELNNSIYVDKVSIKNYLKDLVYPIYHLDFETFQLAVPQFKNTRPYQQLVSQYSVHIQEKRNANPIHKEFLAETDGEDPRIGFLEKLIKDCGKSGDILVYNIGFERGRLNELAKDFPEYSAALEKITNRMKDLMTPFQKKWYYKPEMMGSYSIKSVLPALVPELSYDELEIGDGGTASNAFSSMVTGNYEGDYSELRRQLLEYCKLDTFAMVKLLEKLYGV